MVILIADGVSNVRPQDTLPRAYELHDAGVEVSTTIIAGSKLIFTHFLFGNYHSYLQVHA